MVIVLKRKLSGFDEFGLDPDWILIVPSINCATLDSDLSASGTHGPSPGINPRGFLTEQTDAKVTTTCPRKLKLGVLSGVGNREQYYQMKVEQIVVKTTIIIVSLL